MPKTKKTVLTVSAPQMKKEDAQFAIAQLRSDKMIMALEAIVVSFLSVLTAVFLPEILFRYIYASGQSTMDPQILASIPTVSYIVAALYSVYVLVTNFQRMREIKKLESQLQK